MAKENFYRKLYQASFREALALSREAGISKKAQKQFVYQNTLAIYEDCKRNPKVREYILSKHKCGRK